MTREQFKNFAAEAFETINSLDEVLSTAKGGLDVLRAQLGDAVQAVDDQRDACIGDCAHQLAATLRQGNRAILKVTDNWPSALRK